MCNALGLYTLPSRRPRLGRPDGIRAGCGELRAGAYPRHPRRHRARRRPRHLAGRQALAPRLPHDARTARDAGARPRTRIPRLVLPRICVAQGRHRSRRRRRVRALLQRTRRTGSGIRLLSHHSPGPRGQRGRCMRRASACRCRSSRWGARAPSRADARKNRSNRCARSPTTCAAARSPSPATSFQRNSPKRSLRSCSSTSAAAERRAPAAPPRRVGVLRAIAAIHIHGISRRRQALRHALFHRVDAPGRARQPPATGLWPSSCASSAAASPGVGRAFRPCSCAAAENGQSANSEDPGRGRGRTTPAGPSPSRVARCSTSPRTNASALSSTWIHSSRPRTPCSAHEARRARS